ncbi:MAG: N-acetylmuramoyl-L-alanine amidase [Bacteroidetes bacterium]|nr:N-acetylmuramoyl-L-alanine amidase [Bacteroidota bacterium]MBU1718169.1 N-acetylmuramoyl-L-alanine amidase [Bacteroidota bacterium]
MKRFIPIFVMLAAILVVVCAFRGGNGDKVKVVVIDAGHGGKDPGCTYKGIFEKDIVLSIVLKLGKLIENNFTDVEVIYTRNTDEFVDLNRRAKIANENKADLFISVHANASKSAVPFGFETWVMGVHKNDDNLEVAKKENASILLEDDHSANYEGFDPNSTEAYIIFSLYQNAFLARSSSFAGLIQDQFREKLKREDRGVKQAGFLVLYRTTMPSVLVEAGFLSNADERKFISSAKGQQYIAESLYRAFARYKADVEGYDYVEDTDLEIPDMSQFKEEPEPDTSKVNIDMQVQPEVAIEFYYAVQMTSSPKKISLEEKQFAGLKDLQEYEADGIYKYTAGKFQDIKDASDYKKVVKMKGFSEAFVVAFNNGKRISLNEAKLLSKQ